MGLRPDADDHADREQLHERVPGMYGCESPPRVLVHNGADPEHDREPDPQDEPEDQAASPAFDVCLSGEAGHDRRQDQAAQDLDPHSPGRRFDIRSSGLADLSELGTKDDVVDRSQNEPEPAASWRATARREVDTAFRAFPRMSLAPERSSLREPFTPTTGEAATIPLVPMRR